MAISTNIYGQRYHEIIERKPKYPIVKDKQKIDRTRSSEDCG